MVIGKLRAAIKDMMVKGTKEQITEKIWRALRKNFRICHYKHAITVPQKLIMVRMR